MGRENNSNGPQDKKTHIPENDPSKAMDSKREVEQSNDPKIDQDFPGYPHYPAKEDNMGRRSGDHRADKNREEMPNSPNSTGVSQRFISEEDSKKTGRPEMTNDKAEKNEKNG